MNSFKKILVPIDFTPHSEEALRVASDIAVHYSASITLVYCQEPVEYALPEGAVPYTPPPDQARVLADTFRERLRDATRRAEEMGVWIVNSRLLQGSPSRAIVDFAKTEGFDVIVLGTHGRTGLQHVLMGSVAERVLRTAPCPVMAVKAPQTTKQAA
jgi:universal stress protein A